MNIEKANWQFDSIAELDPIQKNKIDPLQFRKQVIYAGNHVKGESDEFTVDENLIDHWVETGNEMISNEIEIPMPKKHNEDDPELNRGFVNKFVKANDSKGRPSLYVFGKFSDQESAKLAKRANVSLFSPPSKAIAGKVYQRPITHVSFTNYPVIKGLEGFTELTLSYDDGPNVSCPECAKRAAANTFDLSETTLIDNAGRQMAAEAGKAYACKKDGLVLVCAEPPEDAEPYFCFAFCPTGEGGGIDNSCPPKKGGKSKKQKNKAESDVLESLKSGPKGLAELGGVSGYAAKGDPLANPVNAALKKLVESGKVEVIQGDFGEPSFKLKG